MSSPEQTKLELFQQNYDNNLIEYSKTRLF